MKKRYDGVMRISAIFAVLALGIGCESCKGADPHHVEIVVTVKDASGQPVEGFCFASNSFEPGVPPLYGCDKTNAAGVATLRMDLAPGPHRVMVLPTPLAGCCLKVTDGNRFLDVVKASYFERFYAVQVVDGTDQYSLTLVGEPTYEARGVMPHGPDDHPEWTGIACGNHFQRPEASRADGEFWLRGLSRVRTNYLFLHHLTDHYNVVVIPPQPSGTTVELGELAYPSDSIAGVEVRVRLLNGDRVVRHETSMATRVTLVSANGQDVWSYKLKADGSAIRGGEGEAAPVVPVGTYYVCPGPPDAGNKAALALVRLLREGHRDLLDGIEGVKVDVTADGKARLEFDGPACERKIAKVGGYL